MGWAFNFEVVDMAKVVKGGEISGLKLTAPPIFFTNNMTKAELINEYGEKEGFDKEKAEQFGGGEVYFAFLQVLDYNKNSDQHTSKLYQTIYCSSGILYEAEVEDVVISLACRRKIYGAMYGTGEAVIGLPKARAMQSLQEGLDEALDHVAKSYVLADWNADVQVDTDNKNLTIISAERPDGLRLVSAQANPAPIAQAIEAEKVDIAQFGGAGRGEPEKGVSATAEQLAFRREQISNQAKVQEFLDVCLIPILKGYWRVVRGKLGVESKVKFDASKAQIETDLQTSSHFEIQIKTLIDRAREIEEASAKVDIVTQKLAQIAQLFQAVPGLQLIMSKQRISDSIIDAFGGDPAWLLSDEEKAAKVRGTQCSEGSTTSTTTSPTMRLEDSLQSLLKRSLKSKIAQSRLERFWTSPSSFLLEEVGESSDFTPEERSGALKILSLMEQHSEITKSYETLGEYRSFVNPTQPHKTQ